MTRYREVQKRARYVRTNGNLLENTPDGFPSGQEPVTVWYWGDDSPFIAPVNPGAGLAAVTRSTSLICNTISALPWRLLSGGTDAQTSIMELAPPRWMNDPQLARPDSRFGSPSISAAVRAPRAAFWAQYMRSALLRGMGYLIFEEDVLGAPIAGTLRTLNPDMVSPQWQDGYIYRRIGTEQTSGGGFVETDPDGRFTLGARVYRLVELLNPTGWIDEFGMTKGVLEMHAAELGLAAQAVSYGTGSYRSGVPAGYLKTSVPNFSKEQADRLRARWLEHHGGDRRSIAVLNATTDFVPIQMSPLDMALIESRKMSLIDIANAFGVPPYQIGGSDGGSNTYCLSLDTEALTKDGWKQYDEITADDELLTLNHATGLSEWQHPTAVNVFPPAERDMLRMTSATHDSFSTADHRWPVLYEGRRGWVTSDGMKRRHQMVLAAPLADLPTEPKYSDALVEIAAWYTTEGWIIDKGRGRPKAGIAQSARANPENVVRIRRALMSLFDVLPRAKGQGSQKNKVAHPAAIEGGYSDMIVWTLNAHAAEGLSEVFDDMASKVVSRDFLYALTEAQLRLFIDVCVLADGSYAPSIDRTTFKQKNPDCMERFALACLLVGVALSPPSPFDEVTVKKRAFHGPVGAAVDKARGRSEQDRGASASVTRERWTVPVWCPTTPNGTWFARRNGTTYFTGNSNAESRNRDFLSYSLMPWANAVEDVLTSLVPQGQYVEVAFNGLLKPDTATRFASYSTALRDGWLTVGEVRALESLPPLPAALPSSDPESADLQEVPE